MIKFMLLTLSVAALVLLSWPPAAQAQVSETIQAIQALTDYPGVGHRSTGYNSGDDFAKPWGADVRQIKKAAALLQEALSKAGGNAQARAQLEMAVGYANAALHKEARLSAQGALYYLCQGGGGEGCDKAPRWGSYVAP